MGFYNSFLLLMAYCAGSHIVEPYVNRRFESKTMRHLVTFLLTSSMAVCCLVMSMIARGNM